MTQHFIVSATKLHRSYDGVRITRVQNTASYTDVLTVHGLYTYQVCEAGEVRPLGRINQGNFN